MYIEKIKIENFKSIYDPLELDFTNIKGLWKINGDVGSGKTTIGEAVIFGLFGSIKGKNNADLISWGKKHGLIEVWCRARNKSIYINHTNKIVKISPKQSHDFSFVNLNLESSKGYIDSNISNA